MAMILSAFVGYVLDKLATMASEKLVTIASEKVGMVLSVKDELKTLQQLLERNQNFLEAAERLRYEDSCINSWVIEFKDVAYEADDIIDLVNHPSLTKKRKWMEFNFPSVPRYQIAERIKSLNGKLEKIDKDRQQFNLGEHREKQKSQTITVVNTRQTSPLVELDVVGGEIEEATRELVKMIAEERQNKCRVFAVTGMGGIGKTTLAQKIYNSKEIQAEFQIKLWVCVSQSYNEIELLKQVIREAQGNYGELVSTKAELEPLLQSALHGKSLFLVLDDVWKADVWISLLRNPLQSAATIVRILVTTRDENVTMEMGVPVEHMHPIKQLSTQTSWELLRRGVLAEGREKEIEKLADLGTMIAKKCHGLPLAVKAIAGVLKKKGINRKEWENVLKNEAWSMSNLPEELRGALYLSYDDLPSLLKQCFIYCSLFPEDAVNRYDLFRLWVAEGFVKEQRDTLVEDVAEECYNELIRRNLLQPAPNSDPDKFKMHDLFRSLAMFLSQDEISFGETIPAATSTFSRSKLRRLSVENQDLSSVEGLIVEQRCLRTLLNFHGIKVLNDNQLVGLACLRVLYINDADIETIPNSIGDLIHLRYLDFDRTNIKELPESIESLVNLQFLSLCKCHFLTTLPKSITKLRNLRRLGLCKTSLNSFPKGISKLEKINDLDGFVVADPREPTDSYSSLEELNSLYQIRNLHISKMERAQKGGLCLQKLTRLVYLNLLYTEEKDRPRQEKEDIRRIENVLEELCPPPCLEDLHIINFFGIHYPSWMKSPSFGKCLPHLTTLNLLNNISCPQLPPAGELPQLSNLSLSGAASLKSIGPEFLGTSTATTFSNLRILSLEKMPELEDWTFSKEKEGFEQEERGNAQVLLQLDKLFINDCPKLKALPKGLEQSKIKKLYIKEAHSLVAVENLLKVSGYLCIDNSQSLKRVSHLPALQDLFIDNCPALNYVEKLDSLQRLFMYDLVMDAVPEWLTRLLQGRKPTDDDDFFFQLGCNEGVLRRLLKGGPDWPIIERIPRVYAFEDVESDLRGFLQYTTNPYNYETNLHFQD